MKNHSVTLKNTNKNRCNTQRNILMLEAELRVMKTVLINQNISLDKIKLDSELFIKEQKDNANTSNGEQITV